MTENASAFTRLPSSVARRPIAGRLVIATHNPGKLREMRELLSPYGIEAVSASELGLGEPAETGASFSENARIKAMAAATAAGGTGSSPVRASSSSSDRSSNTPCNR
jgi:hypothetical protein